MTENSGPLPALSERQRKLLLQLRAALHAVPRLSGQEADTVRVLQDFLAVNTTLELHPEGNRLWCMHREPDAVQTAAFRADLDAIPGPDGAAFHGCGHDGHSAALAGLALLLEGRQTGRNVLLLFQNAEETGAGALPFRDHLLALERPDCIYGLHNLPGLPEGVLVTRPGTFACASRGLTVQVQGLQAHAAYPEQGRNPAALLSRAVLELPELRAQTLSAVLGSLLMATVVELRAGSRNFGVSAGAGSLSLTLRSDCLELLDRFEQGIRAYFQQACSAAGMQVSFTVQDAFPDTVSDAALLAAAERRWAACGLPVLRLPEPMRWSEDFGWYGKRIPALFFGVGAGEAWPGLHTGDYCFNDRILFRCTEAFAALL